MPFLQGKIVFLKMQSNSLKCFLSTVRDTLELQITPLDHEEFEDDTYNVHIFDNDSDGSDEIDEF